MAKFPVGCYVETPAGSRDRFGRIVGVAGDQCIVQFYDYCVKRTVKFHAKSLTLSAREPSKALEALDGTEPEDVVQQTLLDALVDDDNPGVRVEAINELRDLAASGRVSSDDGHMVSVLRDRMQKDPNTYIRLQSAQVIRELGPRQKF